MLFYVASILAALLVFLGAAASTIALVMRGRNIAAPRLYQILDGFSHGVTLGFALIAVIGAVWVTSQT